MAHARAEFYVLVRWHLGREEASLPDARACPRRLSTCGETSLKLWHWRADRGDAVPPVQPPLDRFGALPVLGTESGELCVMFLFGDFRYLYRVCGGFLNENFAYTSSFSRCGCASQSSYPQWRKKGAASN